MCRIWFAIAVVAVLTTLWGCAPRWSTTIERHDRVVITRDSPAIYSTDGKNIIEKLGALPLHSGDTVDAHAVFLTLWKGQRVARFYSVSGGGYMNVMLPEDDGYGVLTRAINQQPLTFSVPIEDAPTSWGRATDWLVRYSYLKIQSTSENLIQTYSPTVSTCDGCVGTSVSRIPRRDSITFSVQCWSNTEGGGIIAEEFAHRMAYFMATGRE